LAPRTGLDAVAKRKNPPQPLPCLVLNPYHYHSPPSSAEVKNAWSYTATPQYAFMAWCLVKHRDNFTLLYHYQTERKEGKLMFFKTIYMNI
jgi:hypothetical protein